MRKSMESNKGRDTKPELALRRALHARGLRYRVSVRPLPEVRRTADLVFPKAKVAVFVDGCFWHSCPQHRTRPAINAEFWAKKLEGTQRRDAETDQLLAEAGWSVIRVWEHEDLVDAVTRVTAEVQARRADT
ncbi:very short patch repair endonuclease [Actinomadura sp. NPDC023710]|uniref:very short patch repair endonuclease n=1 Tax=Actinomadura sp. NPDC023710 TaxID=3158219 RepID=UPI0033FA0A4E